MRTRSIAIVLGLTIGCGGANEGETGAGMAGTDGTAGASTSSPADSDAASSTDGSSTQGSDDGESSESASGTTSGSDGTAGAETDAETGAETRGDESSTGNLLPRGQWAVTEITYTEGGTSETLSIQDRTFCDATLDGGILVLRYQQQQGYTVWTVNIPQATGVGSHALTQDFSGAYMNINEVSDEWQAYFDPSMAFGTLELTDAQLEAGGVVAGTLTASLTSQDGSTAAQFESTFYAEIP